MNSFFSKKIPIFALGLIIGVLATYFLLGNRLAAGNRNEESAIGPAAPHGDLTEAKALLSAQRAQLASEEAAFQKARTQVFGDGSMVLLPHEALFMIAASPLSHGQLSREFILLAGLKPEEAAKVNVSLHRYEDDCRAERARDAQVSPDGPSATIVRITQFENYGSSLKKDLLSEISSELSPQAFDMLMATMRNSLDSTFGDFGRYNEVARITRSNAGPAFLVRTTRTDSQNRLVEVNTTGFSAEQLQEAYAGIDLAFAK